MNDSSAIQNMLETLVTNKKQENKLNGRYRVRKGLFFTDTQASVKKSERIRRRLQKEKQKSEALQGFVVAILFLLFGTLFLMMFR